EGLAIGAKAVCRDVDEATDIEYGFVGESVKENIIIKEKCDEYEYTFRVNSHGLTAKLSEDKKEIGFYADESPEDVKFKIPAPFMFDAKGDTSTDVHYELKDNGKGEYTFKVIADADWINRDATALPVTLDPHIISCYNSIVLSHTSYTKDSGGNYALLNDGYIHSGHDDTYSYETQITVRRSNIVELKRINTVKLMLAVKEKPSGDTNFFVDGEAVSFSIEDNYTPIDITERYLDTTDSFNIVLTDDETVGHTTFYGSTSALYAPCIEIVYLGNVKSIPTTKSIPSVPKTNVGINVANGSSTVSFCSVAPENSVMGIEIHNTYKNGTDSFGVGRSMRWNLNEKLVKSADSNNYIYTDGEGNVHTFEEYFYYINSDNDKIYLDKEQVFIDEDGNLSYLSGSYRAYREYISDTGLVIVTQPENINFIEDYESRSDERVKLEDEVESYKNALEEYVAIDSDGNQQAEFLNPSKATMNSFISKVKNNGYSIVTKSEALSYKSLKLQENALELQITSFSHQNTASQHQDESYRLQQVGNNLSSLEKSNSTASDAEKDTWVSHYGNLNSNISLLRGDLTTQRTNNNNANSNCSSQKSNIVNQLYYLRKKCSVEDFESYCRKYFKLLHKLDKLNTYEPVSFLKDGGVIKGYNKAGALVSIYNSSGNEAKIEFNADGFINRLYDKDGKQVLFHYDPKKRVDCVTDIYGRKAKYRYNNAGMLSTVTFEDNTSLTFGYTSDSRLSNIYDSDIRKASFSYTDGKLTKVESSTKATAKTFGSITKKNIYKTLLTTNITYSSDGLATTISDTDGITEYYVFDGDGRNIEHYIEEHGVVTSAQKHEYVEQYRVRTANADKYTLGIAPYESFVFEEGDYSKITLDHFVRVAKRNSLYKLDGDISVTTETTYTYDVNNNCIKERAKVDISGDSTTYYVVKKYHYNENQLLTKCESYVEGEETKSGINVEEYLYDSIGNITKTCYYNSLDVSCKKWSESEYEGNKVVAELDALGKHKITLKYSENGDTVEYKYPDGSVFTNVETADTIAGAITSSDEFDEGNSTSKSYTDGLLTRVVSGNNEIRYTYDEKDRLDTVSLNGEDYVTYDYSEDDATFEGKTVDKVVVTNANGESFTTYTDKFGNVARTDFGNSIQMLATYNSDNSISTVTDNVTNDILFHNYESHKLSGVIVENNLDMILTENWIYNSRGNVCMKRIADNQSFCHLYTYNYDENLYNSPLTSVILNDTIEMKPTYDALGRTTAKEIEINGTAVLGEYYYFRKHGDRTSDMISTIRYGGMKNGNPCIGDGIKYHYDCMGNIDRIYENGILTASYGYDFLGRIVREDNKVLNFTRVFAYDNNGNILSTRKCEYSLKDFDELIFIEEKEYLYDTKSDKLLSYNDETFVYDDIGNPTTYRGKTATWAKGRQMTSFDGTTFTYNGRGQRISKGDIMFTYDPEGNLIKQNNGLEFFYFGSSVAGFIYNESFYVYKKDALGNIIEILDSNGNTVAKYAYDAWGNHKIYDGDGREVITTSHIGILNPFRYRSYYFDTETGLYFLQSRYYDPKIGRFITIDDHSYLDPDTINGVNLYAYCGNNPVMNVDPNGCFWDIILDVFSIGWSLYDFIKNPSWKNFGWLVLDVAFAVVPFLTGGSLIKGALKLDNVAYVGKGINKFDNVYDMVVLGNNMERVTNVALDIGATFYGGYGPLNTLSVLGKMDEATSIMKYAAKLDNTRFIIDKFNDGYKFIHIGSDGRGFFKMMKSAYGMELKVLYRLKLGNKLHKSWWLFNSLRRIASE
ncbi:MAG: RHS repeat-associated core domain-containing protein, partial [Clostridia bacterium]|nr:RHS repeat-associated core domain-containing protein [Clostridia bacterium]